jgi:DNA-binding transcriptional LysR family regulator
MRTTKPLQLSPEGDVVRGYASQLLNLNRELMQRLAKPTEIGALRLRIVQQFGYHFLPVWLAEFKREWPNVVPFFGQLALAINRVRLMEKRPFAKI